MGANRRSSAGVLDGRGIKKLAYQIVFPGLIVKWLRHLVDVEEAPVRFRVGPFKPSSHAFPLIPCEFFLIPAVPSPFRWLHAYSPETQGFAAWRVVSR
jgi:hypothetical protein